MLGFIRIFAFAAFALFAMSIAAPIDSNSTVSTIDDTLLATKVIKQGAGDGTWYSTGRTACGPIYKDTDLIVAVSHLLYNAWPGATANPNKNPICGRMIQASYKGKSVRVKVADKCMGCGLQALDFTPAAFKKLAPLGIGRLHGVKWHFV